MTEKEKIEEAKRLYKTANAEQKYLLESLFPELFLSEDERIKMEIVRFINLHKNDSKKSDEWISWLEKQGKPKWSEEDEKLLQQYKMRGYVARDKHEDDSSDLYFGVVCPEYDPICEAWHGFGEFIALPKDWSPELKYTDKPIAVELSIKKIEQ